MRGRRVKSRDCALAMRSWPVARSIFDAPLGGRLCERSERADNKLDNCALASDLVRLTPQLSMG